MAGSPGEDCCCCLSLRGRNNRVIPGAVTSVSSVADLGDILEIKGNRRIRVIHLLGSHEAQHDGTEDEEEDGYWFENASPRRMPISVPPPGRSNGKRIFNKFGPQEPREVPNLLLQNAVPALSSRLTRKTIVTDIKDIDEEEEDKDARGFASPEILSALEDQGNLILQITADSTSPKAGVILSPETLRHKKEGVVIIPDPGESSTDSLARDGRKEEEGSLDGETLTFVESCLGGTANVAFEDEDSLAKEDPLDTQRTAPPTESDASVPMTELLPFSEEKPLLFFIHGIGGSASIWINQINYFRKLGYEIVAPDLLGHGFSSAPDKPKAYTFKKLLGDLLKVFDHYVPLHRKTIIVGHAYGCSFATAMSRIFPENVIHLILCSSGGPTPLAPPPVKENSCLSSFLNMFQYGRHKRRKRYGKSLKFPRSLDIPQYVFDHIVTGQSWPEGDIAFHKKIYVPTLLIYGLKDEYVSMVEMCEMERTISKSYLELLPLAGHTPMVDHATQINSMMKKFIMKYHS